MTPPTPYLADPDVTLWLGDAADVLRGMDADSVDCVVTSPPYWGLRSYLDDGHDDKPLELGLEPTPDAYVARLVAVFREVRRVLCAHGTCWVNLGDSYASSPPGNVRGVGETSGLHGAATSEKYRETLMAGHAKKRNTVVGDLKQKDLVGIPWMVAFALRADGWWLRSDIVWAKPNPMPESVTDRPTKSHEYVFLLTKQPRYWFDQEAVRERYLDGPGLNGGAYSPPGQSPHGNARGPDGRRVTQVVGQDGSEQHRDGERWPNPTGRNVRTVWTIATQPYPEAHFATYPEELVRRCVLAGCPERVCGVCGRPSERLLSHAPTPRTDTDTPKRAAISTSGLDHGSPGMSGPGWRKLEKPLRKTLGWSSCTCGPLEIDGRNVTKWRPGLVLDPFVGSGTTCLVARNHGRHSVGIDLNADYLALAATRLQQLSLLTAEAHASQ